MKLLIDYGSMSKLSGERVPPTSVPAIPVDEIGRGESFKWMKKMVGIVMLNVRLNDPYLTPKDFKYRI